MAGRPRNEQARRDILRTAADLASVDGLDGLTLGRLSTTLGLSKSGLFGYFGSKEELQLATVRRATEVILDEVITPALRIPPGVERVRALCARWLDYSRTRVFPGGCFFFAVMAEFDARPGPLREALAEGSRAWTGLITSSIAEAVELGELAEDTDPAQLAFELIAFMENANSVSLLQDDADAYRRAERAIGNRLGGRRSVITD
ncbi:TetR/AcrR family transcriptional regulator [Pseudonocardia eucalypti]|uniref:TetR/AcrR family transcriptional regulator n=1 Tax=Pseudonocardia eucalypti TaxID=648755 RepID=A0ABP9QWD2_9PSEU|nr:AcrR family transcriptional regulator [Pseudonocardia eucalypti]